MSKEIHNTGNIIVNRFVGPAGWGERVRVNILHVPSGCFLIVSGTEWLNLRDSILASPEDDAW